MGMEKRDVSGCLLTEGGSRAGLEQKMRTTEEDAAQAEVVAMEQRKLDRVYSTPSRSWLGF